MRNEREIRELKDELDRLIGFIWDSGTEQESEHVLGGFSDNVTEALSWVLKEASTEQFLSDQFLDISRLREVAESIQKRSREELVSGEAIDMTVDREPRPMRLEQRSASLRKSLTG